MPMSRETRNTVELVVLLMSIMIVLFGMLFLVQWLNYKDQGECLVQHRANVQEWYYNGITYETHTVSRMICDQWEHPEGR